MQFLQGCFLVIPCPLLAGNSEPLTACLSCLREVNRQAGYFLPLFLHYCEEQLPGQKKYFKSINTIKFISQNFIQ